MAAAVKVEEGLDEITCTAVVGTVRTYSETPCNLVTYVQACIVLASPDYFVAVHCLFCEEVAVGSLRIAGYDSETSALDNLVAGFDTLVKEGSLE